MIFLSGNCDYFKQFITANSNPSNQTIPNPSILTVKVNTRPQIRLGSSLVVEWSVPTLIYEMKPLEIHLNSIPNLRK